MQTGTAPNLDVRRGSFFDLGGFDLRNWAHGGWQRVRLAIGPVLQACVAAALAYNIGIHVFGHYRPFFAAIAAWMCLGWSFDRDLRRVIEIAFGVTLGVTLGDIVVAMIGSGWWQLATVLFCAALTARFISSGTLLATQAGSQAIVIAGLPNLVGGPYGRALDAAIGGLIALIFTVLTPYRPGKTTRKNSAIAITSLSTTAAMLASGLRSGNLEAMDTALGAARKSEPLLTRALDHDRLARRQVRWTINRSHEQLWADVYQRDLMVERAMRSLRVLARRLRYDAATAPLAERNWLADILARYSSTCSAFAHSIQNSEPVYPYQTELAGVAHELVSFQATDTGINTGSAVFRAVIVDTMQAAGATPLKPILPFLSEFAHIYRVI